MNFDIVRAWKDETYRQALSNEQLSLLPTNPAGELSESELALVSAGSDGLGVATSTTSNTLNSFQVFHFHSLSAALCETNAFSAAQTVAPVTPMFSPVSVVCSNNG